MRFFLSERRGFTLVEILVALAVIALLTSVIYANVSGGRKKARDTQRVSDLGQIQLAIRTYRDANSAAYPAAATGEAVQSTSGVGLLISPYLTAAMKDPSGGNYYYNSAYSCNGSHVVLVALAMERASAANFTSTCGGTYNPVAPGATPTANSYILILK